MRRVSYWIFVFLVLSSYSVLVLQDNHVHAEVAYAEAITQKFDHPSDSVFIQLNGHVSIFQRLLARLRIAADREQALCQISSTDFQRISHHFTLSNTVINDSSVSIATPLSSDFSQPDLEQLLGKNIHCLKFHILEQIILQLTGHLS
jgi:hypothetical protein